MCLYDGLYINILVVTASENRMLPEVAFLFRELPTRKFGVALVFLISCWEMPVRYVRVRDFCLIQHRYEMAIRKHAVTL